MGVFDKYKKKSEPVKEKIVNGRKCMREIKKSLDVRLI